MNTDLIGEGAHLKTLLDKYLSELEEIDFDEVEQIAPTVFVDMLFDSFFEIQKINDKFIIFCRKTSWISRSFETWDQATLAIRELVIKRDLPMGQGQIRIEQLREQGFHVEELDPYEVLAQ